MCKDKADNKVHERGGKDRKRESWERPERELQGDNETEKEFAFTLPLLQNIMMGTPLLQIQKLQKSAS